MNDQHPIVPLFDSPRLWLSDTEPPYRCWHCGRGWDTEADLISHLRWIERSNPVAY